MSSELKIDFGKEKEANPWLSYRNPQGLRAAAQEKHKVYHFPYVKQT